MATILEADGGRTYVNTDLVATWGYWPGVEGTCQSTMTAYSTDGREMAVFSGEEAERVKAIIANTATFRTNAVWLDKEIGHNLTARGSTVHPFKGTGYCPVCGHYGEDCTGERRQG